MKFSLTILAQSLAKKLALLIVAFMTQGSVGEWVAKLGITLDATQLTVALFGLYEGFRAWITHQSWWEKMPTWIKALL